MYTAGTSEGRSVCLNATTYLSAAGTLFQLKMMEPLSVKLGGLTDTGVIRGATGDREQNK